MFRIPTGCTVLDCALGGGFVTGTIANIIGSEMSGKTLLSTEIIYNTLLTIANDLKWKYRDIECKYGFNTQKMYGFDLIPEKEGKETELIDSFEDFERDFMDFSSTIKDKDKAIYVLDSLDSLPSEAELDRFKKSSKPKKRKKVESEEINSEEMNSNEILTALVESVTKKKGSYNLEKLKEIGIFFRGVRNEIKNKNLLLLIISQVRMNMGMLYGPKFTRNGGKALDHHAAQMVWMNEIEKYEKKGLVTGVSIHAKVTKNDFGKPFRECYFDILFDDTKGGIDNVSSNIDYLYDLKTPKGKTRKTEMLNWNGEEYKKDKLITIIEKSNLEKELEKRVIEKWNRIEDEISPKNRKARIKLS